LKAISLVTDIPEDAMTFDSTLGEALRISGADVVLNAPPETPVKRLTRVPEHVEPFVDDIVYVLDRLADTETWRVRQREDPEFPQNDDDLADYVMSMTPAGMLTAFGPLVSDRKSARVETANEPWQL